jgi:hypothetical protein
MKKTKKKQFELGDKGFWLFCFGVIAGMVLAGGTNIDNPSHGTLLIVFLVIVVVSIFVSVSIKEKWEE